MRRSICESYWGVTDLDIERMHLNQVYLLCLPSEDLKATRRTVKMTALQAIGAGAIDERKMPSLRTGKSLFQRMKEKIDAEKAGKGTSGGILNKRQRRAKRIAEMAERKRLATEGA